MTSAVDDASPQPRRPDFGAMKDEPKWPENGTGRSLTPRSTHLGMVDTQMRKFCTFGFFLGVALSSVLLAAARLTGHSVWDDTYFGSCPRIKASLRFFA
jgi:hypothetical protein